jgi:putative nucleotidyltransferase with HDIG domain
MELKYRIILSYLKELIAGAQIPDDQKSKEDPAIQTKIVEKLLKDTINKYLPEYKDKVYSVGGFVRDKLLGKNPKDIDIVVDDPDEKMDAAEIFAKKFTDIYGITTPNNPHPLKESYGIWGIILFNPKDETGNRKPFVYDNVDLTGYILELTPPRKEGPYNPEKREPQYVEYTDRKEDASRRDLTINALYQNIASGKIEDYVGGEKDLKNKTLRPPEHPEGILKIYEEDPLRILRLIRFSGKLDGFKIDPKTERTLKEFIDSPKGKDLIKNKVSPERIRDEFQQILTHSNGDIAVQGLEQFRKLDLLEIISPHLNRLLDIYHDNIMHKGESAWQHTMDVIRKTPPTLKARLSALLHDIGKIDTQTKDIDTQGRERIHFMGHENKGPEIAEKILQDLKYPNDLIKSIKNIIHSHMGFKSIDKQKASTQLKHIRIFIEKLYNDLDDAIALIKADNPVNDGSLDVLEQRIREQKEKDITQGLLQEKNKGAEYISPLSGKEIMLEYNNIKGRTLGVIKNKLKEMLMKGSFDNINEKDRAEYAKKLLKSFVTNEQTLDGLINKYNKDTESFYRLK